MTHLVTRSCVRPRATASVVVSIICGFTLYACTPDTARQTVGNGAANPATFGLGQTPSPATLVAIDIDIDANGRGLPPGRGTAAEGAVLYAQQCASCHGAKGEGIRPAPALIGRVPDAGHAFATDPRAVKTIGNYWPYATTIFDYVRRTMPLATPGSLTDNEVYALVAYLLRENGIIADTLVIDATSLPAVQMPARRFFVPDNRSGGAGFR